MQVLSRLSAAPKGTKAMPDTFIDIFRNASSTTDRGYTFLDDALAARDWSFQALYAEARRRGAYFRSLGLEKGDRMAMVVPDGEDFVLSFLGAVVAGIVPVPMYPPLALGKLDAYIETARRIVAASEAKILLTSKKTSSVLWSLVSKVDSLEDLHIVEKVRDADPSAVRATIDDVRIKPEDTCFLQFTSGSTSDPKGVVVTHANLVANTHAIMIDGLRSTSEDIGVSWLPLYHDMGLIGFVVAPFLTGVSVVFIPTMTFVRRPTCWMDTISKYRGTITFAPNFAFGLAAKRASARKLAELDLSCLRVVGCGAEPINADTMRMFVDTFEPAGLSPSALMPAYGMAEATLAVSFDDFDQPVETMVIDRELYESDQRAVPSDTDDPARLELVACGRTFPGHELGIMGPNGNLLPDGQVGEIVFSGPSVAAGYFKNDEASRAAIVGKWLHTGDLGFIHRGKLYVSGRMKDLIILNGRNYYPQSIEWEVEALEGVRRGNVVAFSTKGEDSEQLVVVAETKAESSEERQALIHAIKHRIHEALGIRARQVELLRPGALPKTSSGKVQRNRTKRLFEQGSLTQEGNRMLGSSAARLAMAKHVTSSALARIRHEIRRPARTAKKLVAAAVRATGGMEPSRDR